MSRIKVNPFGTLRRLQERGFSNQQALLLLLLVFPIGLVGLGFAILLIQRQGSITPQVSSPPAQTAVPNTAERPTTIQPLPSRNEAPTEQAGLSQQQARGIVEEWLTVKSQIFAPPFNTELADQVVAEGPLWTDLMKSDGSIQWLKNNNSYYSYSIIRVNQVIRFLPSPSMPSIVVSVTEASTLHSPKSNETSASTADWIYTLKQERGRWKIWDYRKQS